MPPSTKLPSKGRKTHFSRFLLELLNGVTSNLTFVLIIKNVAFFILSTATSTMPPTTKRQFFISSRIVNEIIIE